MALVTLANWGGVTAAQIGVAKATDVDRGTASALYYSIYYFTGALGGYLPGLAWERFRWDGVVATGWIALGSWEAVFPDTLERLFGVGYGFKGSWGVGQGEFEGLTLGALGVILIIALVGYVAGAGVRAQTVETPIEPMPVPAG